MNSARSAFSRIVVSMRPKGEVTMRWSTQRQTATSTTVRK
jgi:hypothetical protein